MEIVKVDPTEFGLKESNGAEVEAKFSSAIAESDALTGMYEVLIAKELTPELSKEAKELRNKMVKVRTSIGRIHKVEKAFFLASGKYVDAWKNRNVEPIQIREEKLMEIEKYEENLEKERVNALSESRIKELKEYGVEESDIPERIGAWGDNIWDTYLSGIKSKNEEAVEVEKRVAENAAKIQKQNELHESRKNQLIVYFPFMDVDDSIQAKNLGELEESIYISLKDKLIKAKETDAKDRLEQEAENKRLKEAEIQRKADAKIQEEKDAADKKIRDAEEAKVEEKRLAGIKEFEEAEKIRVDKEREANDKKEAELKVQQEAKEKAEKELQDIKDAEAKKESERLAAIQAELNKGDEAKIEDLISGLTKMGTKFEFTSEKSIKMYADVNALILKVIDHIKK